jgi:hypothetical protein
MPRPLLLLALLSLLCPVAFAGAFGHGSFQNDDALDWVENELKESGMRAIQTALNAVLRMPAGDYLEAPACSAAIAASEVLAAALGRPAADLPSDAAAAAKRLPRPAAALWKDARAALDRILAKSELRDLWSESKQFSEWKKTVEELKDRLAAPK